MTTASASSSHSLFELVSPLRNEPASPDECSRDFWDRIGGQHWDDLRSFIDRCFQQLPAEERRDVRSRWRSGQDDQLQSVWWELLVHECLRLSGASLALHPTSLTGTKPDFEVQMESARFFLEAHRLGPSPDARKRAERANRFEAALEELDLRGWRLGMGHLEVGDDDADISYWANAIQEWLGSASDGQETLPSIVIEEGGWRTTLHASQFQLEGYPHPRNILSRVGSASFETIGWPLRKVLHHKASRYPGLEPLIIAGQLNPWETRDDDVRVALMGHELADAQGPIFRADGWRATTEDGFWMAEHDPRNTHVAGVVLGQGVGPGLLMDHTVSYWPNPWADDPVPNPCPWWDTCTITPTGVEREAALIAREEFFGLPTEWGVAPAWEAVAQWEERRHGRSLGAAHSQSHHG